MPMSPVTLDEEDRIGAIGLLVRLVRIQDERARAAEARKQAIERYALLDQQWNRCKDAFGAFGFQTADGKELWTQLKGILGQAVWDEAFERARGIPLITATEQTTAPPEPPPTPPDERGQEGSPGAQTETEQGSSTVREIILEELKKASESGRKAAELRDVVSRALGRAVHEKTAGMTLYRLSQDGLVSRKGHTWFIVPPKAETVNPGAAAPGLKDLLS
jgi:hypothetical protein